MISLISLYFIRRAVQSFDDYSVASKSLGIIYTFFSYFSTWISGAIIIGLAGSSFKWGLYQYWIIAVSYCIGFISAPLFLMRIRTLNVYTIGDFFSLRFPEKENKVRILITLTIILRNITIIGAQFSTIAFFISLTFNISFILALAFISLFIILYTAVSGMWGVVGTDVMQGIFQTIGLPLLLILITKHAGGFENIFSFYDHIDGNHYLDLFGSSRKMDICFFFIAPGLFFIFEDQTTWQRIMASKSDKVAYWGYLAPIGAAMLWLLFPCYIGVFSKVIFPNFTAFPVALFEFILALPKTASIIILIALISSAMSTCDSYLLASGISFSHDIYKKIFNPKANEKEMIVFSSLAIMVTGILAFCSSILIYDIFNLYILGAFISGSMIVVPYLFTWFSKFINGQGIIIGTFAGGFSFLMLAFILDQSYGFSMAVSLITNVLASYLSSACSKRPSQSTINETYYWSPKFEKVSNIPK